QVQGAGAQWRPDRLRDAVFETAAWRVATYPLRSFFDVMLAHKLVELALPLLVGVAVNAALVGLGFFLDAQYEEAAAAGSARIYAGRQRLRGRHFDSEVIGPAQRRWGVPPLPYWGGVGPIFWRQLTAAWRGAGRLVVVLFIIAVAVVVPVL